MQKSNYYCRKATDSDDVKKIAQYIHLTDPYIYPHLCQHPSDPVWVEFIDRCLHTKDNLFYRDHIRVVLHEEEIVGIACVIPCKKMLHFPNTIDSENPPCKQYNLAYDGYFVPLMEESYNYDGFNITNICIDQNHRNKGIGTLLLSHCITVYGHEPIHLDVIASNQMAVRLYKSVGFKIVNEYFGFSGNETDLLCYHMLRMPTAQ